MAASLLVGPRGGSVLAQAGTTVSGAPTIDTVNIRPSSGDASLRFTGSGFIRWQLPSTFTKAAYCVAFMPAMNRAAFTQDVVRIMDDTTAFKSSLRITCGASAAPNTLILVNTDGSTTDTQTFGTLLNNNQWYVAEVSIDTSANPWLVQWKVKPHGGSYVAGTPATPAIAATNMHFDVLGPDSSASGWNLNVQDQILVTGSSTYIGDWSVFGAPVTSDGTHNPGANVLFTDTGSVETAISGATSNANTFVKELGIDAGVDRIEQHVAGAGNYVELLATAPNAYEIGYVQYQAFLKQDTANAGDNAELRLVENLDSTTLVSGTGNYSTAGTYKRVTADPPNGGSWSNARFAVVGIRWGYATTVTGVPHLEAVLPVVATPTHVAPYNASAPVVSGLAIVGQTLSEFDGTWYGDATIAYTYQWQRDNAGGGVFGNIGSATGSTYVLVAADVGNKIRCVVTATNTVGSASANSNQTSLVTSPAVDTSAGDFNPIIADAIA